MKWKSMGEGLPPEIAEQVHPDVIKNEAAYWAVRDQLLSQYQDKWIGFADGEVIASGTIPVDVFHAAMSTGRHPFFICVGHEHEPSRIRRTTFPYNLGYPREPMPVIRVEFRQTIGSAGVVLDHVIPDTGADTSLLPWADCQLLQLAPHLGTYGSIGGVGGGTMPTLAYQIWACVVLL